LVEDERCSIAWSLLSSSSACRAHAQTGIPEASSDRERRPTTFSLQDLTP
jgi:hypothetical protein